MPWKPTVPGEIPTLGYFVTEWIKTYLAAPDCTEYEPFVLYREQEEFVVRWYALHTNGSRRFHRGVIGRPRGWGKSPLLAALACVEALAPVVFDGWDADGQPVGRPWSSIKTPWVQIAAASDDQTRNTWLPLLEMLREDAPVHEDYDLNPMGTFVALPNRGRIEKVTSSARTAKGARAHFSILDQTETWVPSNRGPKLAEVLRINATKVDGTTLESPNAYTPGEESVAEASANYWDDIKRGRAKDDGLLYDHRGASPETDLAQRNSLIDGLRLAYGDSSGHKDGCVIHDPPCEPGHINLNRLCRTIWDPTTPESVSRTDFLNQITESADSWLTQKDLERTFDPDALFEPDDAIVLGFDGSRGRARGKADATALVAVRVSDGFTWECRVWEAPPLAKDWVPPAVEIDRTVDEWFDRARVVGFYADPTGWTEYIAKWEARYRKRLRVVATTRNPISLWPRGKASNVIEAVENARLAIVEGEMSHDGSPNLLRHLLNARIRHNQRGYLIFKAYPGSPDKIDAAYAFVLAWKARTDALSKGLDRKIAPRGKGGRILVPS